MFNEFAAGKKLYGSSYAPTRGRVNPSGYVKRELRKRMKSGPHGGISKIGRDGKSDTRSGQAKNMLNKKSVSGRVVRGQGNGGGDILSPQEVLKRFQPVKISKNGQLDLPYDMQASAQLLAKKEAFNRDLLGLQAEDQSQTMGFAKMRRDGASQYIDQQRSTLNNSAARGTAFSSQYGTGVSNNATAYNNFVGDISTEESNWKNQLLSGRTGIQNSFNDFLRMQALDRNSRLSDKVGTLGLGKSKNKSKGKSSKGNNKRIPRSFLDHALGARR